MNRRQSRGAVTRPRDGGEEAAAAAARTRNVIFISRTNMFLCTLDVNGPP